MGLTFEADLFGLACGTEAPGPGVCLAFSLASHDVVSCCAGM